MIWIALRVVAVQIRVPSVIEGATTDVGVSGEFRLNGYDRLARKGKFLSESNESYIRNTVIVLIGQVFKRSIFKCLKRYGSEYVMITFDLTIFHSTPTINEWSLRRLSRQADSL